MTTPENPLVRAEQWLEAASPQSSSWRGQPAHPVDLVRDLVQEVRDLRAQIVKLHEEVNREIDARIEHQVEAEELRQTADKGWYGRATRAEATVTTLEVEVRDLRASQQEFEIENRRLHNVIHRLHCDTDAAEAHREAQTVALRKLMKEAAAVVALAEHALGEAIGNTNLAVFKLRIEEAGRVLSATRQGASK